MRKLSFEEMQREVHANIKLKGFYTNPTSPGERIALVHSELSELLEEFRGGTQEETHPKIPGLTRGAGEMADVVIRMMDMAEYMGINLAEAIELKHNYNLQRPYKHGGKKF